MSDLINGHKFIDGRLVSAKIQRLVDAIREYSHELDVKWIPPEARSEGQAAFKVIHNPPGQPSYTVRHIQTEEEFDERILQGIIAGDQRNGKASVSDFEAWSEAQNLLKQQEFLDDLEAKHDLAASMLRSNKDTYRVDKNTVFKEGQPGNHAHESRKRYF